ncbi:MAG: YIP1 family protein [Nitrososphaerales archaeon]
MGHRTLSLALVFRALILDSEAFDELRDDDDPFVEGLFLLVLIGLITAALALVGQVIAWGSVPHTDAIRNVVFNALQQQPWWPAISSDPQALVVFQQIWDLGWRIFPTLFGAPDPARAVLNLLVWPIWLVLSWLIYTLLAHGFALWMGGRGSLRGTLGTAALSFTPFLLHGLSIVPFLVFGGVLNTWQLLLRYKAVRSAHALSWGRAMAATLLPYLVYLVVWLLAGTLLALVAAAIVGR